MITSRQRLLNWYDCNKRDLPWRRKRSNAYHVMVSELMLQQTTVATVCSRFDSFIARFPSIHVLAGASIDDVLHEWQGLGYYRRARMLHAAAVAVSRESGGTIPRDPAALKALPGIGRYTAAAIAAIAFDEPVVPVDGNIARIVARLFNIQSIWPANFAEVQNCASAFAGHERPGDIAQALMDLGAGICRPKKPLCQSCPLQNGCMACKLGASENLPRRAAKKPKRKLYAAAFLVVDSQGNIQLRRRPDTGLLAGLIELPSTEWLDAPVNGQVGALRSAPAGIVAIKPLQLSIRHVFTHIELEIELYKVIKGGAEDSFWHSGSKLNSLALPTLTKKLLRVCSIGYH